MISLAPLDHLHARVVRIRALQYFTAVTRVLLAAGFIPPGITKILNHRFTSLPTTDPVGYFFDAFYQSGIWYQSVGWAQVIAAVLLLVPRTATLGALLYLPIIVNIALVTIGVGFTGTPAITVLMTLAALYLVCWDYDRWRALLPTTRRTRTSLFPARLYLVATTGWAAAGALAFAVLYTTGIAAFDRGPGLRGLPILVGLGALFGLVTAWHARSLEPPPAPGWRASHRRASNG